MKVKLRHKVPAVVGSAVLLTIGTGAAAYALVCQTTASPTQAGNDAPLDDNHAPIATRSPEPGDDHGIDPTASAPAIAPAGAATTEPADDKAVHASTEPGDDHGGGRTSGKGRDDATAEPTHSSVPTRSSGSGPGRGADDATPHATASPDDRHSGSGGGGSDDASGGRH